jgi:hypothetical protein
VSSAPLAKSVLLVESILLSDAGSHSGAGGEMDEGPRTWSYYFGSSTVMVSRIRRMINHGYFAKGIGREPEEETVPEPHTDEAVVFEEFFVAGLRMPPHPVLADILLAFQVQIHQLTTNAIIKLLKYIWVVMSFRGIRLLIASPRDMSCTISQEKWKSMRLKCKVSMGALIFMPNEGARGRSLLSPSRTNGLEPGLEHDFTARFPCSEAQASGEVKVYLLCSHI